MASKKDSPLATFGTRSNAYSFDPNDLYVYGLDTDHGEDHPLVDDDLDRVRKLDEDMIANIEHRGVIEPIEVTVVDDHIVVINGRRRVVHCREANARRTARGEEAWKIRAITMRGSEDDIEHKLTAISANMFRADHGILAQARKMAQLMNRNVPEVVVANSFGVSVGTIANRMALLGLSAKVQKAVDRGDITPTAALELKTLEKSEQDEALVKLLESGGGRRGQANAARELADPEKAAKPSMARLRKLLATEEFKGLDEQTQRVLRWVVGDLKTPTTIEGLSAAWKATKPAKKEGKKSPPRVDA